MEVYAAIRLSRTGQAGYIRKGELVFTDERNTMHGLSWCWDIKTRKLSRFLEPDVHNRWRPIAPKRKEDIKEEFSLSSLFSE